MKGAEISSAHSFTIDHDKIRIYLNYGLRDDFLRAVNAPGGNGRYCETKSKKPSTGEGDCQREYEADDKYYWNYKVNPNWGLLKFYGEAAVIVSGEFAMWDAIVRL